MMSDHVTRGFRAQVTKTMDLVMRTAVLEISKIFENSLQDYHMELALKGREITELKIKLQRAEIRLRDNEIGRDGIETADNMHRIQIETDSGNVVSDLTQDSDVPEFDFEVPDDWCAPLGCENSTIKEEAVCPSVRLRQLSIPLWPISVVKEEPCTYNINSIHPPNSPRTSRRVSPFNTGHGARSLPNRKKGDPKPRVTNHFYSLRDIKVEYPNIKINVNKNDQESNARHNMKTERTSPRGEPIEKGDSEEMHQCNYCDKVFDSDFGRVQHQRWHKRCRGCRAEVSVPSALKGHLRKCKKYKKLLAKLARSSNAPKAVIMKEKTVTSNKKRMIKKERESPSDAYNASLEGLRRSTTEPSEVHCQIRLKKKYHHGLAYACTLCPRKFHVRQALKVHMTRRHPNAKYSENVIDLNTWTAPLEEPDINEDTNSTSDNVSAAASCNTVEEDGRTKKKSKPKWATMGKRCQDRFACLRCGKLMKTKYVLYEHYRIHTGEKPYKCEICSKRFRTSSLYSFHRKKKCQPCKEEFSLEQEQTEHDLESHKDSDNQLKQRLCPYCGKGYALRLCLKKHIERFHKQVVSIAP